MEANSKHILVIDDDGTFIELLKSYLSNQGFKVNGLIDGSEVDTFLRENQIDLILLDLMLPGEDGLSILRRLRESTTYYPIIMMSAAGNTVERVIGLEVGADDYLLKPVDFRELLARIRAVLRRCELLRLNASASANKTALSEATEQYQFGNFCLNIAARQLFLGKDEVALTNIEYNLLLMLVSQPNRVHSRDDLLSLLKRGQDTFSRSIDVHIRHLRCKIEPDPSNPTYICTRRGEGYIFYNQLSH